MNQHQIVGLATLLACASAAMGQGATTNQVRLELRVVSQTGLPGSSPVISTDADQHPDSTSAPGVARRFEIQYRLVDLDTNDALSPAGLVSGNLRITATGGTLERAILSRFEARNPTAGTPALPPVSQSVDLTTDSSIISGNATIGAFRGMHAPFRGGIPAPAPNNDNAANGVFESGNTVLRGISPLVLSQSDQADGGWYGLYSVNFVPTDTLGSITAAFDADATTGNRFGFFTDGDPVPVTSPVATTDSASIVVGVGPLGACCRSDGTCSLSIESFCAGSGSYFAGADTACQTSQCPGFGACCTSGNVCTLRTETACGGVLGLYRGDLTTCLPNLCPPPYACCLPGFVCLLASTPLDCTTAGGTPLLTSTCVPQICCPSPVVTAAPVAMLFTPPQAVSFNVGATHPGTLAYQWRRNGAAILNAPRITGATAATLNITSSMAEDAGSYDVVVTSSCGKVTTSAAADLTLCSNPTLGTHPVTFGATAGGTATLNVGASGLGMLLYQWRKDGAALEMSPPRITGTTGPALTINDVGPSDDGLYDCVVANPCGAVTSQLAAVTVSCVGSGVALDCNANQICDALELTGLRDITAPAPAGEDRFGWSVAIDGARLLVGARSTDRPLPAGVDSGSAHIYLRQAEGYLLEAALSPTDLRPGDDFGSMVALQGEWAVISARYQTVGGQSQAGAVYIYRRASGTWTLFQKLIEPAPIGAVSSAWFGHGIDLDSDRLVIGSVGSHGVATHSGVSYVYRFNGLNWAREATLMLPDGMSGDGFGISVAIDDPYLIVGTPYRRVGSGNVRAGAAYVYFRSSTGWLLQSSLGPPNPETDQTYGELVDISGDHAIVNAPRETVSGLDDAGVVYTYRRTDTRWTKQRRLSPPMPQAAELYGYYIALENDTLAIGGFRRTVAGNADAGSVDIFRRRGNFWTRADRIDSPKAEAGGFFGYSLAIDEGKLAAGAFRGSARLVPGAGWVRVFDLGVLDCDDDRVPDVCEIADGSVFDADGNGIPDDCQVTACRPDFNDNGVLSVQDIFDFLMDYFEGNLTADFNDSGSLSVQDIFELLAAFFGGCD